MSPHIVQPMLLLLLLNEGSERTIKKQRKTFYSHLHISARGDSCEGIYVVHKTITTERGEKGSFTKLFLFFSWCAIDARFHFISHRSKPKNRFVLCTHIGEWSRVEHEHITGKLMLCERLGMTENTFCVIFSTSLSHVNLFYLIFRFFWSFFVL